MINNTTQLPVKKLHSTASMIYEPLHDYTYSHHASITYFKGRFYAMWSNGIVNEDDCGQRIMLAESADAQNWENLRPIVTPEMLGDPLLTLTAAGFYTAQDTLHLYYGRYRYQDSSLINGMRQRNDSCHKDTGLGYISTTDGINWSTPADMGIPLVPNHGPQKTASGRLIISGNFLFPYTDNPDGVNGYQLTGIHGDAFQAEILRDDSESIHHVTQFNHWNAKLICEGSFFQTDDRVLHMMLRSNTEYLWCTDSFDDGVTWSAPYQTAYTDSGSKFHFGRLPDGRFYGVSNTVPGSERIPLTICLSRDGENFDTCYTLRDEPYTQRFAGLHKGGVYGYPHTLIHDGYMYIIYSLKKESVAVTKLSLDQLH